MRSAIVLIAITMAAVMANANSFNAEEPLFGEQTYVSEWSKFVSTFEKKFVDEAEKLFRFAVFQKNFDFIHSFNRETTGVELAVNEFSALTKDEFKKMYLGSAPSKSINAVDTSLLNYGDVPASVDWVTKGAVTEVKNQGQCGSCWAFSTVGSVEGAIAVSTGLLESLSEQQLVDCDYSIFGNKGCNGGLMDTAFKYVMKNGLALEKDYTYTAAKGSCQSSKYTAATNSKISGFKDVPKSNEAALKQAVAQQPVSVAIEADTQVFQFYKSGVLSDAKGCGTSLDHGVLVVGYGTQDGKDFWKVKNSWGASWGQAGYILLARTDSTSSVGMCGLATQPSYATVTKAAALPIETVNTEAVEQIVKGLLTGFASKDLPDVMPCLTDAGAVVTDLKAAVADFELKTVSGIADGLRQVASALDAIKAAMTDCKAAEADVQALITALEALKSPKEFIYHVGKELIVNGKDVFAHVTDAVAKYKSADFFAFGSDLGYIVAELVM